MVLGQSRPKSANDRGGARRGLGALVMIHIPRRLRATQPPGHASSDSIDPTDVRMSLSRAHQPIAHHNKPQISYPLA